MPTLLQELKKIADPQRATLSQRYFKTGPGEYGEGDVFLGIKVPDTRKVAKRFLDMSFVNIEKHIYSKYHEVRLAGFEILVMRYEAKRTSNAERKKIFDFVIKHRKQLNNWDLVDGVAPYIIGKHMLENVSKKKLLYTYMKSKNLWERRISIISTFAFIDQSSFSDTLSIAEILLNDDHDLIHKAVGWALREVGNRDQTVLCTFLDKHTKNMPRIMLRYSIERFSEQKRKHYLKL